MTLASDSINKNSHDFPRAAAVGVALTAVRASR